MNQLETNLEEKISANIQTVLKTHIETEVGKVKQELIMNCPLQGWLIDQYSQYLYPYWSPLLIY
jgi:transcriptional regulatory protein LevR